MSDDNIISFLDHLDAKEDAAALATPIEVPRVSDERPTCAFQILTEGGASLDVRFEDSDTNVHLRWSAEHCKRLASFFLEGYNQGKK